LNLKNRWFFFGLTYLYVITLYLLTNRYTLDSAHYLRLSIVDVRTPFLPWTAWVYITVYIFPLSVGFICNRDADVKPIVFSFVILSTICTACYIFYPTTFPRPPLTGEGGNDLAMKLVRFLDTPANCLPSQHVALGFLSAFFVQRYNRRLGNWSLILGILISISTLTTKQHYLWDVVAGYFLSRVVFGVASRYMDSPRTTPSAVTQ
jgi:membrane-associated phospholipid phosphatase